MTHSPAPWTVEADRFEMHVLASDHVGGSNTIASVYARSNAPDAEQVQQANAALLAAAPELLQCARMLAALEADDGGRLFPTKAACQFARAAIAKATA